MNYLPTNFSSSARQRMWKKNYSLHFNEFLHGNTSHSNTPYAKTTKPSAISTYFLCVLWASKARRGDQTTHTSVLKKKNKRFYDYSDTQN